MFISPPLRYPGGKSKLADFVSHTLEINGIKNPIYCEPFCGGAGVAIKLLLDKKVDKIILNDYDIAIYSFWNAVLNDTENLSKKIINTPITIKERENQKQIYAEQSKIKQYSLDLAFSTLFLNRTSMSGVIKGGAIGGKSQNGKYKVDARFNKDSILSKIENIARCKDNIQLFNFDAIELIHNVFKKIDKSSLFVFFDPPYYKQGKIYILTFLIIKIMKI